MKFGPEVICHGSEIRFVTVSVLSESVTALRKSPPPHPPPFATRQQQAFQLLSKLTLTPIYTGGLIN